MCVLVCVCVCVPFVCLCRCTAYAVCTACHTVSPYMLVVNPPGNGGGIPVTMEMSKLICNKISTWERLIQGKVLIYSSWWMLMHFLIRSDVWLWWLPIRWLLFIFQTTVSLLKRGCSCCAFLAASQDKVLWYFLCFYSINLENKDQTMNWS